MKRQLSALFLALMLSLSLLSQGAVALTPAIIVTNPFTDVSQGALGYDSALWAYYSGVTTGTSQVTFSPKGVCTRAQTVTFLWRAMGSPEPAAQTNPFLDVTGADYFYKPVLWAVEKGITSGTTATTFSPNATTSYAEAITFLWRANGSPLWPENHYAQRFPGQYFVNAVTWASEMSMLKGLPSETSPDTQAVINTPCQRQDLVQMLYANAGYPDILKYGTPLTKYTSGVPYVKAQSIEYSYQYYIALDIEATQVLTAGESGTKFTFTAEGTMFDIFRPLLTDNVTLPDGSFGQYWEVPGGKNMTPHFSIRTYDERQYTLDIAGNEDKAGSWVINYPSRGTANQHYDFVQAPNDAAGNIRAYIKTLGGNYVVKTDNGLEITTDKATATAFYFIRAEQSALGQKTAHSARG